MSIENIVVFMLDVLVYICVLMAKNICIFLSTGCMFYKHWVWMYLDVQIA
jgi:hypothetical protein